MPTSRRRLAPAAAFALLLAPLPAQFVGPGLSWANGRGGGVRSFVPGCTPLGVAAFAGDTITLTVWGDVQSPYVLLASLGTAPCQPIPGLQNGLSLAAPVVTVTFGVLTQTTPCLACPPGLEPLLVPTPPNLPAGLVLAVQAAALGGGTAALTTAIAGTF